MFGLAGSAGRFSLARSEIGCFAITGKVDAPKSNRTMQQTAPSSESAIASDRYDTSLPPRRGRRLFAIARIVLLLVLLLAMATWLAQWMRTSVLYVHETDARIMADIVTVSSRTSGNLVERRVSEGDRVVVGQVIGRIDAGDAELAMTETSAERETARAVLARLDVEADLIRGQIESRIASARSGRDEAEAAHRVQEHEYAFAEADFQRTDALARTGAVPDSRLERARADLLKAQQELRRSAAALRAAGALLAEATTNQARLAVKQAERVELEARVAEIEARLERQRLEVEKHRIVSPVAGVVDRVFVIPGEYVSAGQRLVMLHDPDRIWVDTNIRETEIGRVEPGLPVRIQVDAWPDQTFTGTVALIGNAATSQFSLLPRINASGNFTKVTQRIRVRIDLDQHQDRLKPGMMVEVSSMTARPPDSGRGFGNRRHIVARVGTANGHDAGRCPCDDCHDHVFDHGQCRHTRHHGRLWYRTGPGALDFQRVPGCDDRRHADQCTAHGPIRSPQRDDCGADGVFRDRLPGAILSRLCGRGAVAGASGAVRRGRPAPDTQHHISLPTRLTSAARPWDGSVWGSCSGRPSDRCSAGSSSTRPVGACCSLPRFRSFLSLPGWLRPTCRGAIRHSCTDRSTSAIFILVIGGNDVLPVRDFPLANASAGRPIWSSGCCSVRHAP